MTRLSQTFSAITRPAILILLALTLQGCAISNLTSSFSGGWFGSKKNKQAQSNQALGGVSEARLLAAAKSDVGGGSESIGPAAGCPQFVAWPGGRTLTKYESGREGDGLAIMYRGEITKTARECKIRPGEVGIRYGFAGRVLLGPRGRTGTVKLPILVHVTDRNLNKIQTQKFTVSVSVAKDDPIGYFSEVQVVKFPIQPGVRPLDYKLYVAFPQRGDQGR